MKTILNLLKWWSLFLVITPYRLIKSDEKYARYCGWFIIFSVLQLILFIKTDFMLRFILVELIMAYAIGLAIIVNKSTRTTKDKLIHIALTLCLCLINYSMLIKRDEQITKKPNVIVKETNLGINFSELPKEECAKLCDEKGLSVDEKVMCLSHYDDNGKYKK